MSIFYVNQAANSNNNNGRSWDKAYADLQQALTNPELKTGDEIWVAKGVYKPGTDREDSFVLVEGVKIYGGFGGTETHRDERDWETNKTKLSGDLGENSFGSKYLNVEWSKIETTDIDSSHHVVIGKRLSSATVLDGFTITGGYAVESNGGGLYCDGSSRGNYCNPTLRNLIFFRNYSKDKGGAMYNTGSNGGESSPTLTNVTFSNNGARGPGGAMYNDGSNNGGKSSPTLTNVKFSENHTTRVVPNKSALASTSSPYNLNSYGGAMVNDGSNGGESSPTLTNVKFSRNSAFRDGGAMVNDGSNGGKSSPTLTNVKFFSNLSMGGDSEGGGAMYNNGSKGTSSPTLTNVTFFRNNHWLKGGAMVNNGSNGGKSSPTLTNVTFSENRGDGGYCGGAMINDGSNSGESSPTLTNVTFFENRGWYGGAMYNNGSNGGESSPTLTNATFSGNRAERIKGGAMVNDGSNGGESSPTLTNATFSGNQITRSDKHELGRGGAIYNDGTKKGKSSPTLTNVTFSGNYVGAGYAARFGRVGMGGAMYNDGTKGKSSPTLTNVILWDNRAVDGSEVYNNNASPTISYSIVQGGVDGSGFHNEGDSSVKGEPNTNLNVDPCFVQPVDLMKEAPSSYGNLRLQVGSPAIGQGNNSAVSRNITTDLDGNPRIVNNTVDIGSYETPNIIYVNQATHGDDNDGSSWNNAYTDLQQALTNPELKTGDEIWVAKGTFKPTKGTDRKASFILVEGVKIYGGFLGDEKHRYARDWKTNPTTLSGDIGAAGDDSGNSYHVVYGEGLSSATVLDGFTITRGNADGDDFPNNCGGGLFCDGSGSSNQCNPTLSNLIFSGNEAKHLGGAMFFGCKFSGTCNPTLTNITFSGNRTDNHGGATAFICGSSSNSGTCNPILTNITFSGNRADNGGGAMVFQGGSGGTVSPTLTNITFSGNHAHPNGGAIYIAGGNGSPTLTNVILWENRADRGSEMYIYGRLSPTISHSIIKGGISGSGIHKEVGIKVTDGDHNLEDNPLFVDPVDPTKAPTTAGDLHLQAGSPAIGKGKDGVDIGAYEDQEEPTTRA